MLNKDILNDKYSIFLPNGNKEAFIKECNDLKAKLDFKVINQNYPVLLYMSTGRRAISYLMSVNYSLQANKILDFEVISGQTFNKNHFAIEKERDSELIDSIYHTPLLFLTLTETDVSYQYLMEQLIDMIDFRYRNGRKTVVMYNIIGGNHLVKSKQIYDHFNYEGYSVLQVAHNIVTGHSVTNNLNKVKPTTKQGVKRII